MNTKQLKPGGSVFIESKTLGELIGWLKKQGYSVIGPTIRDNAITLGPIDNLEDLPMGWTDEQEAGKYRLTKRDDKAFFGHVVGPHSWKRYLHPPEVRLFAATRQKKTFRILDNEDPPSRYAFLGVRGCDLAAIKTQDRVLLKDKFVDSIYQERRRENFIVAVNCTQAAPTCFCTSMGTGPKVEGDFDLCLTELILPQAHRFLVEIGSPKGVQAIEALEHTEASEERMSASCRGGGKSSQHDQAENRHVRNPRTHLQQSGKSTLGQDCCAMPQLRQLYDGLSNMFLHDGPGRHGFDRCAC